MEFRQLQAFLTVAKTANFTRAAEMLGYAQSSITTQIQLLEQEFNTRFFDRLGHRVVLTDQGQCFLTYANQILALASEAKEAVSNSTTFKGTVTIGAPESLCATRLPSVLKEYGRRYPNVKIVLKIGSYNDFLLWLRNNSIDLAFFFQRETTNPNLITTMLLGEPIVAVTGVGHPLIEKGYVEPSDLREQTVILAEPGCSYRIILESILSSSNVYPETVLEIGSVAAMTQCAISGLGIAFLPRVAIEKELEIGQLVDLHWSGEDFNTVIQLAYHKDKWLSSALKAFLTVAKEVFSNQRSQK
jgi:Transcriptional regulator